MRVVVGLLWLLHWLPLPLLRLIGLVLGSVFFVLAGKRRRIVHINLQRCFPEASSWRRIGWLWQHMTLVGVFPLDLAVLAWGSERRLRRLIQVDGAEHFTEGQGNAIVLSFHMLGLGAAWSALTLRVDNAVDLYAQSQNPHWDRFMTHAITRFNNAQAIPRQQGFKPVLRLLKRGHVLAYFLDVDPGPSSAYFSSFMGSAVAMPSVLPRLLVHADRVLIMHGLMTWRGFKVHVESLPALPENDAVALWHHLNGAMGKVVRQHPTQYLWLHRRFKTQADGRSPYR